MILEQLRGVVRHDGKQTRSNKKCHNFLMQIIFLLSSNVVPQKHLAKWSPSSTPHRYGNTQTQSILKDGIIINIYLDMAMG